ncbi:lasso peptide biosynthesis B2 protein [Kitasatospora sp. NPDC056184]|uniref:lasso peptide biosynthesis B2 protein n=1 Tax=Kitasatospora sp. NPDC056184 TaxID=3345738 RepID=UPI0035DFA6AA
MPDQPAFITQPRHIRGADFGHALALIDYRSGEVRTLLPAAAGHLAKAARTGRARDLPDRLLASLLASGLLMPTEAPVPWTPPRRPLEAWKPSWGGDEHRAGLVPPPRVPLGAAVTASIALGTVLAVKAAGPPSEAMLRVVRLIHRAASTCLLPATPEEAEKAVKAVRRAGWYSPGRTACLEESAAAVLLLAARRQGVTWCHGLACDPIRLHAWIQTGDALTAEPDSTAAYTPVLMITGAPHRH